MRMGMINLLESMHKCCLHSGVPSESQSAYEMSLIHKIFFLDLSLEVSKTDSVLKALEHFTAVEQLDGGARHYKCQRCKVKVRAQKQLTVDKAPYVLTIHLKRFESHMPQLKIDKKVHFEPTLIMKPFVSGPCDDLKYTLYGVLVHAGWSTHSGHYYCFVHTSHGLWYYLDDNRVSLGYVLDEWDEEYDRGKRKKVKRPRDPISGWNPFQEIASMKAQRKRIKTDRVSYRDQPFRI
ncbi:Ubiquitin carboxyl-terminal hydrolase 23 [Acorus gramineus]|uniref:Ubiquitin carboxyl-terminal hydrolase 23 n=1 Tax=Acorus gramineus TaxID=55184 RepID=A0AAV8ZX65_ACOGR|nr:Ubiquitin carboxyl-terminal hydrolase 23 [Acorus gramineus]